MNYSYIGFSIASNLLNRVYFYKLTRVTWQFFCIVPFLHSTLRYINRIQVNYRFLKITNNQIFSMQLIVSRSVKKIIKVSNILPNCF